MRGWPSRAGQGAGNAGVWHNREGSAGLGVRQNQDHVDGACSVVEGADERGTPQLAVQDDAAAIGLSPGGLEAKEMTQRGISCV